MHLNSAEHEKLKRMGFSKVYYSSYGSGHRRGVAILLSHKVPFNKVSEIKDTEGRYLLDRRCPNNTIECLCPPQVVIFLFIKKSLI